MRACDDFAALLVQEADGMLDATEHVRLELHLRDCSSCRAELDTQRTVRAVLRSRAAAPVPARFEEQLAPRLTRRASWLPVLDWRRWTLALAPVPVILLVVLATGVPGAEPASSATVRWQAWEEATGPNAPVSSIVWQPGMNEESIFVAALTARPRETLQEFLRKHADQR